MRKLDEASTLTEFVGHPTFMGFTHFDQLLELLTPLFLGRRKVLARNRPIEVDALITFQFSNEVAG